jgi:hypothetical protein
MKTPEKVKDLYSMVPNEADEIYPEDGYPVEDILYNLTVRGYSVQRDIFRGQCIV